MGRRRRGTIMGAAVVLALAAIGACSSSVRASTVTSTTTAGGTSSIVTHQVVPATTGAGITTPEDPHIAMVGGPAPSNGFLVVFLPGSNGAPRCCQVLLRQMAQLGYHAIGLSYPNSPSVAARCANDLACYGQIRANVWDGSHPGADSAVTPADSVHHRLAALLGYLARRFPAEGWGSYLAGGDLAYDRIVFSGHSQGGGEAAYVGKVEAVSGVVMLSSVVDSSNGTPPAPAPWLGLPGKTPLTRYTGFDHTADTFYRKIRAAWTGLGLDSLGLASVDGAAPPFGGSHELITSVPLRRGLLVAHDSTAVDNATPLCPDGGPRFAPVWADMLSVAVGAAPTPTKSC